MRTSLCLFLIVLGAGAAQAQGVDARTTANRKLAYFVAPFVPDTRPIVDPQGYRQDFRDEYRAQEDRPHRPAHPRRDQRPRK